MAELHELGIQDKVFACVTDNTASALKIADYMQRALNSQPFFTVRCSAHLLQLVVKHGLDQSGAQAMLNSVRTFGNKVRKSSPLSVKLMKMCERVGDEYKRPLRDTEVRWNSTFNLIQALPPMETAINRLFRDDNDFKTLAFANEIWDHLRDLVKVLQPFAEATVHLQGLRFTTVSAVGQIINMLVHETATHETDLSLSDFGRRFAETISFELDHYVPTMLKGDAPQFAAVLEPFVKLTLAGQGSDANGLRTKLKLFLELHYEAPDSDEPIISVVPHKLSFLERLNQRRGVIIGAPQTIVQQLDQYLETAPPSTSIGTLQYWEMQMNVAPNLARFARDVLAIPGSTAASESVFSRGKMLISDRRNTLTTTTVFKMMCIDNWQTTFVELMK